MSMYHFESLYESLKRKGILPTYKMYIGIEAAEGKQLLLMTRNYSHGQRLYKELENRCY